MEEHLSTKQLAWVQGRSPGSIRDMIRDGEMERLIDEVISMNEQRD